MSTFTRSMILIVLALLCSIAVGEAQAVCEGLTGNGRCNSSNSFSVTIPTTNTDGTGFNDYASTEVLFGLSPGVCATTVGVTVRNLGPLGVPVTPLPNTVAKSLLGPLGLPNAKVFATARVVDLVGNRSGCAPEVSFTNDNVSPAAPGISVGP